MKTARHNRYFCCMSWLIAVGLFVVAGVGCEDDKTPPTSIDSDNDIGRDAAVDDTSDVTDDAGNTEGDVKPGPCDGVVCVTGEACVDGDCVAVGDIGFSCEAPRNLGTLVAGTPLQIDGNSDGQPVLLKTGCSAKDHSSQSVFKFRVEENTEVHVKFLETTLPVVMELREDGCVDGSNALFCDAQPRSFEAKAGKDYYLVIEARHDYSTGNFKVELSAAAQACSPAGGWTCEGTQRVQCYAGTEKRAFECGSGCISGVCTGDTCENAIVVDGSVRIQGISRAFENNFDFKDSPSCSTDRLTGPVTSGQDVVFSLSGLKVGQLVKIDTTTESGRGVIGITKSCGISAGCIAADDQSGKLNWTVDVAGDYFVVIDRGISGNVPFDYRIEVLD